VRWRIARRSCRMAVDVGGCDPSAVAIPDTTRQLHPEGFSRRTGWMGVTLDIRMQRNVSRDVLLGRSGWLGIEVAGIVAVL
jgi:hypothetical protein